MNPRRGDEVHIKMKFKRSLFNGFLIWIILYVMGLFLSIFVPSTKDALILLIGILVVYTFSRIVINEKNLFEIGMIWFLVNLAFNLILMLLGAEGSYPLWSSLMLYFIIIVEPSIVKYFSG